MMKRRGRIYAKQLLKAIYSLKILPRWVIILIDVSLIGCSTVIGYLLRFNFSIPDIVNHKAFFGAGLSMSFGFLAIILSGSYKGIVRHTGMQDVVKIFYMLLLHIALLGGANFLSNEVTGHYFVPYSVALIAFLASFLFLFNYRLLVKYVFSTYNRRWHFKSHVLIYGAGSTGLITKQVIQSNPSARVIGFLEDDPSKVGKILNGTRIFDGTLSTLDTILADYRIDELVITIKDISSNVKNALVDICLKHQVKVRMVPPLEKWVKGQLSINQIKEINIEDLLERDSIKLINDQIRTQFAGKRICITGAAGSIGSEIVRQISLYAPQSLVLMDQSESALFEIDREIKAQFGDSVRLYSYIVDIANEPRVHSIFSEHKPQLVFHAAAYKHVPLMESNPSEAVSCNVIGTRILADLSVDFGVEKFVMISTDKAVNPTNVMGCSKRIAEIYVQSLDHHLKMIGKKATSFVTTRFGNVLGSNGSVIPVFKKQIAQGGPVTVTHPEITRYFMTIPEACQLVLEAGAMGKGGEIFIFDMGEMVKIHDLAKRMIRLSGLVPGKDIDIVFTGLRNGEKLYEELLNQKENTLPTHHEKIMIANVQHYPYHEVASYVNLLYDLMNDKNELKLVALMKEIVPEFKSNYSRFEVLDHVTE